MVVAIMAAGLRGAIAFALAKSLRSVHEPNISAATTATVRVHPFRAHHATCGGHPSAGAGARGRVTARRATAAAHLGDVTYAAARFVST